MPIFSRHKAITSRPFITLPLPASVTCVRWANYNNQNHQKENETFYSGTYSKEYIVHRNDLLIGMDGEFNIARWSSNEALLNQRVCKIIAKNGTNEEYLRFAMSRKLKEIEEKTSFVTVKHLSAKELKKIILKMPNIEKQNKIANILVKLEDKE